MPRTDYLNRVTCGRCGANVPKRGAKRALLNRQNVWACADCITKMPNFYPGTIAKHAFRKGQIGPIACPHCGCQITLTVVYEGEKTDKESEIC